MPTRWLGAGRCGGGVGGVVLPLEESGDGCPRAGIRCTGGLPASLVAKEVGLRRTTAYAILKGLAQKGFVQIFVKRGRQIFIAEKPQNIAGQFENKLKAFTTGIPLFESLQKKSLQATGLRFIETVDELKKFYAGVLRQYRHKSYVIMGNSNAWQNLKSGVFYPIP